MSYWYAGRGKGRGDVYIVKRNNIQSWVNRTGCLSLPRADISRLGKRYTQVMFFDLITHTKFITDADNFRNAEQEDGSAVVKIENFDVIYATQESVE